jgi:hypothetical protein
MELTREYLIKRRDDCRLGEIEAIKQSIYNKGGADMIDAILAQMDAPAPEPKPEASNGG